METAIITAVGIEIVSQKYRKPVSARSLAVYINKEVGVTKRKEPGIYEIKNKDGSISWKIKFYGRNTETNKPVACYETLHESKATYTDAKKRRRELLNQVDKGTYIVENLTLEAWANKWIEAFKSNWENKTLERNRELLRNHILPYRGNVELRRLTPSSIQELYGMLRLNGKKTSQNNKDNTNPGLSERSIHHVHRVLSQCLKWAVIDGKLTINPCTRVVPPKPPIRETKIKNLEGGSEDSHEEILILNVDQQKQLLEAFKETSLYEIVALAMGTGMRRGEIVALRWQDIDFEKRTLRIWNALEETSIAGVQYKKTKNKSSKRTIKLDPCLLGMLRAHKLTEARLALGLGISLKPEHPVFRAKRPEGNTEREIFKFRRPSSLTSTFPVIAKKISGDPIFQTLTLHHLRHTHASQLIDAQMPITQISKRLGHNDSTTTLRIYGHFIKESEERLVEVVHGIMREVMPTERTGTEPRI